MPSEPPVPPPGAGAAQRAPGGPGRRWATPRRLHPASVVLGIPVRQLLQAIAFPVVVTLGAGRVVSLVVLGAAGLIGLGFRFLAWQRYTFSFDGEVMRVEEGVLSRSARSLDVARVQQVEIDRGPIQRLFGLAALRVETAGSSTDVEVDLRVVEFDEAVALRDAIREGKARVAGGDALAPAEPTTAEPERNEMLRVPLKHVVIASVTGARLLFFPAVIAGLLQFAGEVSGQFLDDLLGRVEVVVESGSASLPGWGSVTLWRGLLLAAGIIVLAVVAAVAVGILQDANYRVTRVGDDLHIARGLLSTRESVVPLRRVQLVAIQRNWLRRLLGYATVRIDSAGGSGDADRRVTVPLLADTVIDDFVGAVLPAVPAVPELVAHPPQARRRIVFRWLRPPLVLVALIWVWNAVAFTPFELPTWTLYAALMLLPTSVLLGLVEHRHLGHALTDRVVVSRRGALSITTGIAPVMKVQAASRAANWFQRRLGLTTVAAHLAGPGGDLVVLDTSAAEGRDLHVALVAHAADPDPVLSGAGEPQPAQ